MQQKEDQHGRESSYLDYDLHERQGALLNQIDALVRNATINNGYNTNDIHYLKQEYNQLVNRRAKPARIPLSDPMDALPPELWPDIIKDTIVEHDNSTNKLLDLVSVSKSWFFALTTLPVIWTTVRLDQSEADYLAKAMTCIKLSRECQIDLHIYNLRAEEWQEISIRVIPEGRRIRRISFEIGHIDLLVTRQILGDFTELPVLKHLSLPYSLNELSDEQYIHALMIRKMPSIEMVRRMGQSMQTEMWNPFITSLRLRGDEFRKETLEALARLPRLQFLAIEEDSQSQQNAPGLPQPSFTSLIYFGYNGPALCHHLRWIGNNISSLSTEYPENGDHNALLVAVSRLPRLNRLRINIFAPCWGQPIQNTILPVNSQNSVKYLTLSTYGQLDIYEANWEVLFPIFFAASPCLEALTVRDGFLTDTSWGHIRSIESLQDLTIGICNFRGSSASISLNTKSLRNVSWSARPRSLGKFLSSVQAHSLQTFSVTEFGSDHTSPADSYTEGNCVVIPHYSLSGSAFPNITSLIISTANSVVWELGSLFSLRELQMQAPSYARHSMHWIGDVLEAILMKPRNNPKLEKITICGDFMEWDILLLMLERRNFLNIPNIFPISALTINYDLPYRLLYPLSELLGGRFVERDSNYSYSIAAVGERMWEQSHLGCTPCHSIFRKCESVPIAGDITRRMAYQDYTSLDQGYSLPSEYLIADPPLAPNVAHWLSGKRERRKAFVRQYREVRRQFYRAQACKSASPDNGKKIITGNILMGAHFGDE